MLTPLNLNGVLTLEGHTASSPPQHKPWEPWPLDHLLLCFMGPPAAHYPVFSLEPGYSLASLFLGSSLVLGHFGTEASSTFLIPLSLHVPVLAQPTIS